MHNAINDDEPDNAANVQAVLIAGTWMDVFPGTFILIYDDNPEYGNWSSHISFRDPYNGQGWIKAPADAIQAIRFRN